MIIMVLMMIMMLMMINDTDDEDVYLYFDDILSGDSDSTLNCFTSLSDALLTKLPPSFTISVKIILLSLGISCLNNQCKDYLNLNT